MAGIVFNHDLCTMCLDCVKACPFNALDIVDNKIELNASCKTCKMCIKACCNKAISFEEKKQSIDKDKYTDCLIYVEHNDHEIHPVTLELIGKAHELMAVTKQDIKCIIIGNDLKPMADHLLEYGVSTVYIYDAIEFKDFKVDIYANAFEDCINYIHPSVVLVGATVVGRSLAPRVAARFKSGLTADCTLLNMKENTDLVQIRPAFGGNIMAQIVCTNHRPQFATVRYKVMKKAEKSKCEKAEIIERVLSNDLLKSKIIIEKIEKNKAEISISEAEILIVQGRGVREDHSVYIDKLAKHLNAMVACTRPLVEAGLRNIKTQVGLSGRTVKPKLIITFGVSGAIQFSAGMNNSEMIIAINNDPKAPIFDLAHMQVVGDANIILENIINKLEEGK